MMILVHAFLLASLLAFSHGILKWLSGQNHSDYFDLLSQNWLYLLISLSIYGFIFFYYVFVLRNSPISILYPIYTGLSVLFVLFIGKVIFNEVTSIYQIFGATLILAGIIVMGGSK